MPPFLNTTPGQNPGGVQGGGCGSGTGAAPITARPGASLSHVDTRPPPLYPHGRARPDAQVTLRHTRTEHVTRPPRAGEAAQRS